MEADILIIQTKGKLMAEALGEKPKSIRTGASAIQLCVQSTNPSTKHRNPSCVPGRTVRSLSEKWFLPPIFKDVCQKADVWHNGKTFTPEFEF